MTDEEWRAIFRRLAELLDEADTGGRWGDEAQKNGTLIRLLNQEAEDGKPPGPLTPK